MSSSLNPNDPTIFKRHLMHLTLQAKFYIVCKLRWRLYEKLLVYFLRRNEGNIVVSGLVSEYKNVSTL